MATATCTSTLDGTSVVPRRATAVAETRGSSGPKGTSNATAPTTTTPHRGHGRRSNRKNLRIHVETTQQHRKGGNASQPTPRSAKRFDAGGVGMGGAAGKPRTSPTTTPAVATPAEAHKAVKNAKKSAGVDEATKGLDAAKRDAVVTARRTGAVVVSPKIQSLPATPAEATGTTTPASASAKGTEAVAKLSADAPEFKSQQQQQQQQQRHRAGAVPSTTLEPSTTAATTVSATGDVAVGLPALARGLHLEEEVRRLVRRELDSALSAATPVTSPGTTGNGVRGSSVGAATGTGQAFVTSGHPTNVMVRSTSVPMPMSAGLPSRRQENAIISSVPTSPNELRLGSTPSTPSAFSEHDAPTNLYINGLPAFTTDDSLLALAACFGQVRSHKAMINNETGMCKGFGFVMYASHAEARCAMSHLTSLGFQPSWARESFTAKLRRLADPTSSNVYLSNLPAHVGNAELEELFRPHAVVSMRILTDPSGNSRGVGFVRLRTREVAQECIDRLHGMILPGRTTGLQVRFADSEPQKHLKQTVAATTATANTAKLVDQGGNVVLGIPTSPQSIGSPAPVALGGLADANAAYAAAARLGELQRLRGSLSMPTMDLAASPAAGLFGLRPGSPLIPLSHAHQAHSRLRSPLMSPQHSLVGSTPALSPSASSISAFSGQMAGNSPTPGVAGAELASTTDNVWVAHKHLASICAGGGTLPGTTTQPVPSQAYGQVAGTLDANAYYNAHKVLQPPFGAAAGATTTKPVLMLPPRSVPPFLPPPESARGGEKEMASATKSALGASEPKQTEHDQAPTPGVAAKRHLLALVSAPHLGQRQSPAQSVEEGERDGVDLARTTTTPTANSHQLPSKPTSLAGQNSTEPTATTTTTHDALGISSVSTSQSQAFA